MASTEQKTETIEDPEEEEMGGLDDDADDCLILISSEDDNAREFEISRKAALMCNLVKSILEGGVLSSHDHHKDRTSPTHDHMTSRLSTHSICEFARLCWRL